MQSKASKISRKGSVVKLVFNFFNQSTLARILSTIIYFHAFIIIPVINCIIPTIACIDCIWQHGFVYKLRNLLDFHLHLCKVILSFLAGWLKFSKSCPRPKLALTSPFTQFFSRHSQQISLSSLLTTAKKDSSSMRWWLHQLQHPKKNFACNQAHPNSYLNEL